MKLKNENKTILAVGAHPDDVEILCAGTLLLLRAKGWNIVIATMTAGDCGSATLNRDEISKVRKNEAIESAKILEANYHCMENDDVFIMYDRTTLLKTIDLIRKVKPNIVITHSPQDYMVDHEITSKLVRTACFSAGMKNILTNQHDVNIATPYLYYMDALEGKDIFGNLIKPTTIIDISSVIDAKETMLKCHKSQRDWLMVHHGIDEYIITMKNFAIQRGQKINVKYAEGFRQHLGHGYPEDNILEQELILE